MARQHRPGYCRGGRIYPSTTKPPPNCLFKTTMHPALLCRNQNKRAYPLEPFTPSNQKNGINIFQTLDLRDDIAIKQMVSPILPDNHWHLPPPPSERIRQLADEAGLPVIIASLLFQRGCNTPQLCHDFLHPVPTQLHRPENLPDIDLATERIVSAIKHQEPILVYGDYDVDGVCGTAILVSVLRALGAKVYYYLPHRHTEGYGVSSQGVEFALRCGIRLMITNDCGSNDIEVLNRARNAGIDIIVTDHHEPGNSPPPALAFINPKRADSNYPFRELAGAGVAFKLAWKLLNACNRTKEELISLLDLVGLATIADVVPLTGENRIIARLGLTALSKTKRPGLKELFSVSRLKPSQLSARNIAFIIAPRLNAAGRVGHARIALELLLTEDPTRAHFLAEELEQLNRSRQEIEDTIFTAALRLIEQKKKDRSRVIVLAERNWNEGIIGIVAARLVEEFWRPCVLISLKENNGKGSARSVTGFNLYEALTATKQHLITFGGHRYAAGLQILPEEIPQFEEAINNFAASLPEEIFKPSLHIEAIVQLEEITPELIRYLKRLEPFGPDNPEPIFASTELEVVGYPRRMGRTGEHLKFKVRAGKTVLSAIAWQRSKEILNLPIGKPGNLDICYTLTTDEFNGKKQIQLNILDLRTTKGRP